MRTAVHGRLRQRCAVRRRRGADAQEPVLLLLLLLLLLLQVVCSCSITTVIVVAAIRPTMMLAQGLVGGIPLTRVVVVVVVSREHPARAGAPALEHVADFLAERAWEADGERVRAHAAASDGVFAAARGAVRGRGLAVAQEEIDAGACGDDDACEHDHDYDEGCNKMEARALARNDVVDLFSRGGGGRKRGSRGIIYHYD